MAGDIDTTMQAKNLPERNRKRSVKSFRDAYEEKYGKKNAKKVEGMADKSMPAGATSGEKMSDKAPKKRKKSY